MPTEHTAIHAELPKKLGGRNKKNPSSDTTPPEQRELYGENITGFCEVVVDLNAIRGFKLVNKQDIPKPCTVMLRYKRLTQVTTVKVTD